MDTNTLNTKIELCEDAVELYVEDDYSMSSLIDKTGKTASEIYAIFPTKKSILEFYYPLLIIKYRAMIGEIEDFESYSISEKFSNFAFTLFDMMDERREFVEQTFEKLACTPSAGNDFHKELRILFRDFTSSDSNISSSASVFMGNLFYGSLKTQYLLLIKFWLQDDSENQERTWALTDKFTGFMEELLYSKIADKGFDLLKYTFQTSGLNTSIEDFNTWVESWFEDEPDKEFQTENEDEEEIESNNTSD